MSINATSLNVLGQLSVKPLKRSAIRIADIGPSSQGTGIDKNEKTKPPDKAIKNANINDLLFTVDLNAAPSIIFFRQQISGNTILAY